MEIQSVEEEISHEFARITRINIAKAMKFSLIKKQKKLNQIIRENHKVVFPFVKLV